MVAARWRVLGCLAVAVPALAGVERFHLLGPRELKACEVLPSGDVARVVGVVAPAEPFQPDGTGAGATGCSYGRGEPGVYLTVFSVARGGGAFLRQVRQSDEAHGVDGRPLRGPGYLGYSTGGPTARSESVMVVKHDHYVNVVVHNAPAATAERLGIVAARTLD